MRMNASDHKAQPWVFGELANLGMSWAEIARQLGESPAALNNWKSRGFVPPAKWPAVAALLGKPLEWVRSGKAPAPVSLSGASGPALAALLEALGYPSQRLDAIWERICDLSPEAGKLDGDSKAKLVLLVADTFGESVRPDQLAKLMHHIK